jgi:hypothetical protein
MEAPPVLDPTALDVPVAPPGDEKVSGGQIWAPNPH